MNTTDNKELYILSLPTGSCRLIPHKTKQKKQKRGGHRCRHMMCRTPETSGYSDKCDPDYKIRTRRPEFVQLGSSQNI